jgi:hypothetical protein
MMAVMTIISAQTAFAQTSDDGCWIFDPQTGWQFVCETDVPSTAVAD